ncbi:MAG: bifunctional 5,10-methylenetetrahydrofolate dehydrogenase/5,10-methenyltetrahydrofolate cyclohydrolase [Patescibacteria group bacterium]
MSMKIPGKEIAEQLQDELKLEVSKLSKKGKKLKLVDIVVGDAPDQVSFVKIKEKMARKLGIGFEFVEIKNTPSFEDFAHTLKQYSADPTVTGIIVQQPLPFQLQTDSLYNFIHFDKEIEGHKEKSDFSYPLGLAVLTTLKYIFKGATVTPHLFVELDKDAEFFRKHLRNKKIVILGRGTTAGKPIGQVFNSLRLDYICITSQTFDPDQYIKTADIIITAVGKKVIQPEMLKPGVILLNVGVRTENEKLKGDYDENEIKNIASFYTSTPGGIGPIDVSYLYKNLIDAAKLSH